jgi:hypothetical protein
VSRAGEEERTEEAVALLRNVIATLPNASDVRPRSASSWRSWVGVPVGADYVDTPVRPVLFKAEVRGTRRPDPVPSSVPDLDYHPFVEAADFMASVQKALSATSEGE